MKEEMQIVMTFNEEDLNYIREKFEIENKNYRRVLLCATGALMNPIMVNQKNSIPCIAHVIELEGVK